MSVPGSARRPVSAHVVVLGNEKGGSGKSTLAMHVAVALLNAGEARRRRRDIDFVRMDWVVVRNRMSSPPASGPSPRVGLVGEGLEQLAARLGFRCIAGFAEREIYRELFPRGLTGLDPVDPSESGTAPAPAHASVQQEVMRLIDGLKLPLNETGRRRSAARQEWFAAQGSPLEVSDFIRA